MWYGKYCLASPQLPSPASHVGDQSPLTPLWLESSSPITPFEDVGGTGSPITPFDDDDDEDDDDEDDGDDGDDNDDDGDEDDDILVYFYGKIPVGGGMLAKRSSQSIAL